MHSHTDTRTPLYFLQHKQFPLKPTPMGAPSTYNTANTHREKTTAPMSHLHEQLPAAQALGTIASHSGVHPLVSVAAAAYVLALLYLPSNLLSLLLISPVSLTTLLVVALLHLGSSSASTHSDQPPEDHNDQQRRLPPPCAPCAAEPAAAVPKAPTSAPLLGLQQKPVFSSEGYHFADWARRGPLEVIYEEYEGEAADEVSPACSQSPRRRLGLLEGIDSLAICCYTDDSDDEASGSDDSPAWDSQEDLCFRWEEEDEGLIEIALDEDNLIEIDISGCR